MTLSNLIFYSLAITGAIAFVVIGISFIAYTFKNSGQSQQRNL